MASGKEIRTKIGSIKNTQKITSAMEMVAASKMRRAQERMQVGKPYAQHIRAVVGHIAAGNPEYKHHYLEEREVKRVGYIVVSTDRGLCGGLNINTFKAVIQHSKVYADQQIGVDLCLIGAKSAAFFTSVGGNVVASVRDIGEQPQVTDLIGSVKVMLDGFVAGKFDKLFLAGSEFVNTMTQNPMVRQLLPLKADEDEKLHQAGKNCLFGTDNIAMCCECHIDLPVLTGRSGLRPCRVNTYAALSWSLPAFSTASSIPPTI